jgi:hypothetical protein
VVGGFLTIEYGKGGEERDMGSGGDMARNGGGLFRLGSELLKRVAQD